VSLDATLMKIAVEANHVSIIIAKILVKKTLVDQTQCVLYRTKERAALVHLEWFQVQLLKLAVFDRQLFHARKIVIALKVLLVSMTTADQFVQTMPTV
jgi:hypothetical protein